jgi:hypothetical protein
MTEFDLPNDANLYRSVQHISYEGPALEEALANRGGGDPVEWIPEAEAVHATIEEIVKSGGSILLVERDPDSEGPFAGYYEVRLYDFGKDLAEDICRILYATGEQKRTGSMLPPEEGIFMLDVPSQPPIE